jgi:hypothetical protein
VTGRLRDLAERPLDRRIARAALVTALAVSLGLCAVIGLGVVGGARRSGPAASRDGTPESGLPAVAPRPSKGVVRRRPPQDPQDRPGSAAHRRALAELRSHRALQHVPYRHGGVTIRLAGARGRLAILRVSAATIPAARSGWRLFLRRFDDGGSSYRPVFSAEGRDG